jgi:hypothetical protein
VPASILRLHLAPLNVASSAGWEITENWRTEQGFGARGFISFIFGSLDDHAPDLVLRAALTQLLTEVDPPLRVLSSWDVNLRSLSRDALDHLFSANLAERVQQSKIAFVFE